MENMYDEIICSVLITDWVDTPLEDLEHFIEVEVEEE